MYDKIHHKKKKKKVLLENFLNKKSKFKKEIQEFQWGLGTEAQEGGMYVFM